MSVARQRHINNVVLGGGEIYIDLLDEDDNRQGERYLGDSVGATIGVTSERTTIQSNDGAMSQALVDVVRSVSRVFGFTLRDSSIENWALFLIGTRSTRSVAAGAVANEALGDVKAGRWYQLGYSDANPSGVGAVKHAGGTTVQTSGTEGEDYVVDAPNGRIQFLVDRAAATVSYTPTAARTLHQAHGIISASQINCALRYLEESPAAGKGRNVYIRKCNLVPGGEAALKSRETEQQMAFTATIQDPGPNNPAIVIDGEELT